MSALMKANAAQTLVRLMALDYDALRNEIMRAAVIEPTLFDDVFSHKPASQTEWQREALAGQKINAIKLYRATGGRKQQWNAYSQKYEDMWCIGLKEAKDHVENFLATY